MTMRDTALEMIDSVIRGADQEHVYKLAGKLAKDSLRLSGMLSEPEWGVGMLEDVAEIVGKDPNPDNEPRWERH